MFCSKVRMTEGVLGHAKNVWRRSPCSSVKQLLEQCVEGRWWWFEFECSWMQISVSWLKYIDVNQPTRQDCCEYKCLSCFHKSCKFRWSVPMIELGDWADQTLQEEEHAGTWRPLGRVSAEDRINKHDTAELQSCFVPARQTRRQNRLSGSHYVTMKPFFFVSSMGPHWNSLVCSNTSKIQTTH